MRQQVNVNVDLIFDVDATLTREQLLDLIDADLKSLINPHDVLPKAVDLFDVSITNLLEEADIYG